VYAFNRSEKPAPEGVKLAGLREVAQCDILFLCTAISSIPAVCAEIAPMLGPETIVCDTCSVKVFPVDAMVRNLPARNDIIATHPMFGPDSARNGVSGLPMVMSPVRGGRFSEWKERFSALGIKVIEMSPEEHDREAARTQGLTHLLGRLLAELDTRPSPIATLGYRKLSEVMEQTCNDPWQLFIELQTLNPYSSEVRAGLGAALDSLLGKIDRS